jgi:hypothetical protein
MPTATPRVSHSPQRRHARQLRGLLVTRPPGTSTQQVHTIATHANHDTSRWASRQRHTTSCSSRHHDPTENRTSERHTSHADTRNGHGNNSGPECIATKLLIAPPHAPNPAQIEPLDYERAHTPPTHDTTPQRTRALTTVGAAAGAVAVAGTAGDGCITSHDSISSSQLSHTRALTADTMGTAGSQMHHPQQQRQLADHHEQHMQTQTLTGAGAGAGAAAAAVCITNHDDTP